MNNPVIRVPFPIQVLPSAPIGFHYRVNEPITEAEEFDGDFKPESDDEDEDEDIDEELEEDDFYDTDH